MVPVSRNEGTYSAVKISQVTGITSFFGVLMHLNYLLAEEISKVNKLPLCRESIIKGGKSNEEGRTLPFGCTGIPIPESRILRRAIFVSTSSRTLTLMDPPAGLYLIALLMRLESTCSSDAGPPPPPGTRFSMTLSHIQQVKPFERLQLPLIPGR